mmetsp:Transcript_9196/g.19932  ORF Transcript_9196/g.19932 Transcript_9196/m.19932 type:complete len:247 (+) Transcript_9196:491-1231(+)
MRMLWVYRLGLPRSFAYFDCIILYTCRAFSLSEAFPESVCASITVLKVAAFGESSSLIIFLSNNRALLGSFAFRQQLMAAPYMISFGLMPSSFIKRNALLALSVQPMRSHAVMRDPYVNCVRCIPDSLASCRMRKARFVSWASAQTRIAALYTWILGLTMFGSFFMRLSSWMAFFWGSGMVVVVLLPPPMPISFSSSSLAHAVAQAPMTAPMVSSLGSTPSFRILSRRKKASFHSPAYSHPVMAAV